MHFVGTWKNVRYYVSHFRCVSSVGCSSFVEVTCIYQLFGSIFDDGILHLWDLRFADDILFAKTSQILTHLSDTEIDTLQGFRL